MKVICDGKEVEIFYGYNRLKINSLGEAGKLIAYLTKAMECGLAEDRKQPKELDEISCT